MRSLKSKLIGIIVAIVVVVSIANLAVGVISSYNGIVKNVEQDMAITAKVVDKAVSTNINLIKQEIDAVASDLSGIGSGRHNQVLKLNMEKFGYEALAYIDSSDEIICTNPDIREENLIELDCVVKARKAQTTISTTQLNKKGELVIYVATPIEASTAIVVAVLDGQHISDIIKDIVIGESGEVFILDSEGTMIGNVHPELVDERQNFIELAKTDNSYAESAVVWDLMKNGETGTQNCQYNNINNVCSYMPISGSNGWSVGVMAPLNEMTTSVWVTVISLTISTFIFIIISVICAMIFAKSIATPVINITNRIKLLSEGDLTSPVMKCNSNDEIGVLTNNVSETVSTLKIYVNGINDVLENVAGGKLTVSQNVTYKGEFVSVGKSLETILVSLNQAFYLINQSADQVSSGSEQVSNGAQALSQGATEQASAIQQLSATINEISEEIKSTAANAVDANKLSSEAVKEVEVGNEQMEEMIKAMAEISETSKEIGRIIKTIDDIAFQTNILALNAAVEAARAGVAGKGFAVVADEVRNLAGKSAEAAKNTTSLIERSIKAVAQGTKIVDATAISLHHIVDSTKETTDIIDGIAKASQSQSTAVGQVTMGIEQISGVVQTNSATAQQSAAASEQLSSQSQILKQLVSMFEFENNVEDIQYTDDDDDNTFSSESYKY